MLQNSNYSIIPNTGSPAININDHVDIARPPYTIQKFQFNEVHTWFRPMLHSKSEKNVQMSLFMVLTFIDFPVPRKDLLQPQTCIKNKN